MREGGGFEGQGEEGGGGWIRSRQGGKGEGDRGLLDEVGRACNHNTINSQYMNEHVCLSIHQLAVH